MYVQRICCLVVITLATMASGTIFDCNYDFSNISFVGNVYQCRADVTFNQETLVDVRGAHLSGLTNNNVRHLFVIDQNTPVIPKGISRFFPDLTVITWYNSHLKTLTSDSLNFPNLVVFGVWFNQIPYINGNLFQHNPKLKLVDFDGNLITHVGRGLLDGLNELQIADFSNNICIDEFANTPERLIDLKQKLEIMCADPNETTTPATTRIPPISTTTDSGTNPSSTSMSPTDTTTGLPGSTSMSPTDTTTGLPGSTSISPTDTTTGLPGSSTVVPTTTTPQSETTAPTDTTTGLPGSTSISPKDTTTGLPGSTSISPTDTTTGLPGSSTVVPTTTTPQSETTAPTDTTTGLPGSTSMSPTDTTTGLPGSTSVSPTDTTTGLPGSSTVVPTTTTPQSETTAPTDTTTGLPGSTSMSPTDTTTLSGSTSEVPSTKTPPPTETTTTASGSTSTTAQSTTTPPFDRIDQCLTGCPMNGYGFLANRRDCTRYYFCERWITNIRQCPEGQIFDVITANCGDPETSICIKDYQC